MAVDAEAVSLLVGDTSNTYISTDQINTLATLYGENPFTVAAAAARVIAAQFAAAVTKKAGDVSINASDRYKHYMDLARDLDRKAALHGLGAISVFAGGISQSDKLAREQDTDRVDPYFTRDLHNDLDDDERDERWGY